MFKTIRISGGQQSMKRLTLFITIAILALLMATAALAQDSATADEDAPAAYITLNLDAGHPLDPFLVSVNGGGDVDASTLSEECSGYINADPTVTLNWTGEAEMLEAFFYSDHDPVLVIETPDGEYLCNDDAHALLLDPVVEIDEPAPGQYSIWVGAADEGHLLPGILVLTTRPELNVGNFALGELVRRESIPEEPVELEDLQDEAGALLEAIEALDVEAVALETGMDAVAQDVTSDGEIPAFEVPTNNLRCTGFVSDTPDYVFDWSGETDVLRLFFEGDGDATLVVATPDSGFVCNDDAFAYGTLNPLVDLPAPAEGRYSVFVGHVNPAEPVSGSLTIIESTEAEPTVLEAGGN
jgi:hypothetical protein